MKKCMVKSLLYSHDIVINEPQFSRLLSSGLKAIIEMLSKFMPRLSEVCEPLRWVTMKDVDGTGQNIKSKLSKN